MTRQERIAALKAAATATVPIVQRHLAEVDRMIAAAR